VSNPNDIFTTVCCDLKDKEVVAETCYFVSQEAAQNFLSMILSPNPSTIPVSVTAVLHSVAKKRSNMA
ncbi:4705_t:CDS:1, partial [Cetraspora pellucida]